MINDFYYDGQLRRYLLQFCNVFYGLHVKTGIGECGVDEYISVPIRIGSRDRVVAAIEAGNTRNQVLTIPMLAAYMTNIQLAPGSRKGVGVVDRRVALPPGGAFPADLHTVIRVMPIPYTMSVDLTLYASNTDQLHQLLEQILVLFDPALQIQTSDGQFDWTKITTIELVGLTNEETYPAGDVNRVISWTLSFEMPIYISLPLDKKDELVRKILIRIGDLNKLAVREVDANGNLVPFEEGALWGTATVDQDDVT
jgi:hypothetical protein